MKIYKTFFITSSLCFDLIIGGDDEEAEDAFDDRISHAGIIQDIIEDISLFDLNNSHDS